MTPQRSWTVNLRWMLAQQADVDRLPREALTREISRPGIRPSKHIFRSVVRRILPSVWALTVRKERRLRPRHFRSGISGMSAVASTGTPALFAAHAFGRSLLPWPRRNPRGPPAGGATSCLPGLNSHATAGIRRCFSVIRDLRRPIRGPQGGAPRALPHQFASPTRPTLKTKTRPLLPWLPWLPPVIMFRQLLPVAGRNRSSSFSLRSHHAIAMLAHKAG